MVSHQDKIFFLLMSLA